MESRIGVTCMAKGYIAFTAQWKGALLIVESQVLLHFLPGAYLAMVRNNDMVHVVYIRRYLNQAVSHAHALPAMQLRRLQQRLDSALPQLCASLIVYYCDLAQSTQLTVCRWQRLTGTSSSAGFCYVKARPSMKCYDALDPGSKPALRVYRRGNRELM